MQVITSKDNEIIKNIKKLKEKKYRDEENKFLVEGIKMVQEAISEDAKIAKIVICEDCINDGSIKQDTQAQNLSNNDLTKDYLTTYVANQINALEGKFQGNFNELMRKIENLNKQNINTSVNNSQNANNQRTNINESD